MDINTSSKVGYVLVGVSAIFLVPGLVSQLIQYDYVLAIAGLNLHIMTGSRSMIGPGDRNESSICRFLYDDKNYITLALVFGFGVLIPVVKLALCAAALFYRRLARDQVDVVRAQQCVAIASKMSKWAATDAMAEAVVVAMFLKVNNAHASHRVGYFCFVVYCMLSTLAFAFVMPFKGPETDIRVPLLSPALKYGRECVAGCLRDTRVRVTTVLTTLILFLFFLALGAGLETVHIWMPRRAVEHNVMEQLQKVPALQPFIATQGIQALRNYLTGLVTLNTNISMSGSIYRLLHSGHLYTVSGSFMLFFCAYFLPVWDAILSTALALTANIQHPDKKEDGTLTPIMETSVLHAAFSSFDRMRQLTRHLAMLDVLLVGLLLGLLVASTEQDLQCSVLGNSAFLVLSVFMWYLHSFICDAIMEEQESEDEEGEEDEEDEPAPAASSSTSAPAPAPAAAEDAPEPAAAEA